MDEELLTDFDNFTAPQEAPIEKVADVIDVQREEPDLLSDFDSFSTPTQQPIQQEQLIDPIEAHRPQDIDDSLWDDIKSRVNKFMQEPLDTPLKKVGGAVLATMGAVPTEGIKQTSETIDYAKSDYAKAMASKSSLENFEFAFSDLSNALDSATGDENATLKIKEKRDR